MKKQHQHQAHMQNGNNDTTNVDPGILAFGTSVSINDDLRRSISNEIQEIDSNCTKIKDDINIESKIQDELSKGKVHANNEIAALCQGVIDANDALHMNTQILHGLANTLQTEIASHRSNPEHTTESDNNEVDSTSLEYIRKGQMSRSKRLVELKSSIISKVNQLNEMNIKKKEIQESSEIISMKIDEELEMPLTKAIESTLHAQRILDSEISRIHSMNVNVVAATERVEAMKKKLENKKQEVENARCGYTQHENEARTTLMELEEKARLEGELLQANEAEKIRLQQLTEEMTKEIELAENLIAEREGKKNEREVHRSERNKLFTEQTLVGAEIARVKEMIEAENRAYIEHERTMYTLKEQKETNDKLEAQRIIPGKAELLDLKEEESKLDSFLKMNPEEIVQKEEMVLKICDKKKELDELDKELNKIMEEIKEKKGFFAEQTRIMDAHDAVVQEELSALEQNKDEKIELRNELEMKINTKLMERQKFNESEEYNLKVLKRKLDVLRHGRKLLEKTKEKESSILKEAEACESD